MKCPEVEDEIDSNDDLAIVKDCKVGRGTKIWNYANVYGCEIGENCTIGAFVEITSGAKIGNNVIISSHSFICDFVTIGDNVFIGHGVMTVNDIHPPSRKRGVADWKRTYIEEGAMIGTNATLLPVRIGKYAQVGAGAVVTKDVPAYATVVGNPARIIDDGTDKAVDKLLGDNL